MWGLNCDGVNMTEHKKQDYSTTQKAQLLCSKLCMGQGQSFMQASRIKSDATSPL